MPVSKDTVKWQRSEVSFEAFYIFSEWRRYFKGKLVSHSLWSASPKNALNISSETNITSRHALNLSAAEIQLFLAHFLNKFFFKEWTRVTQSWIENTLKGGVTLSYSEEDNGLAILGQVTSYACGSGVPSGVLTIIKGYWTKIKYTQEFRGVASCWSIFGNNLVVNLNFIWAFYLKWQISPGIFTLEIQESESMVADTFF